MAAARPVTALPGTGVIFNPVGVTTIGLLPATLLLEMGMAVPPVGLPTWFKPVNFALTAAFARVASAPPGPVALSPPILDTWNSVKSKLRVRSN